MTATTRPRGRRLTTAALIALALLLLAYAPAAGAAATTFADVARDVGSGPLAAGPDKATWALERTDDERLSLARYAAGGELTRVAIRRPLDDVRSDLVPLAGGAMGAVVAHTRPGEPAADYVAFARFGRDGTRVRLTSLPAGARAATAFAIARDGTVWFARTCRDALYRWRSGERLARFPLPRRGCTTPPTSERSTIALGPDGTVWVASDAQERLVRRDARGRTRSWRLPTSDAEGYPTVLRLLPDPRGGGVAYGGLQSDGMFAGRVTRDGRLVVSQVPGLLAYAADGTLWRARGGAHDGIAAVERTSPRGAVTRFELPATAQPFALAIGRDGRPWALAGTLHIVPSFESHFRELTAAPVLALRDEVGASPAAIVLDPSYRADGNSPLVRGGDGALWTYLDHVGPAGAVEVRLVRIGTPGPT